MVNRAVMTSQAGFVTHFLEKSPCPSDMTEGTLLRKDRVSLSKRAAGVGFLTSLDLLRQEPAERENWNGQRKPETPAAKRMPTREVLQVNPPSELLGCARPSQHRFAQNLTAMTACHAPNNSSA